MLIFMNIISAIIGIGFLLYLNIVPPVFTIIIFFFIIIFNYFLFLFLKHQIENDIANKKILKLSNNNKRIKKVLKKDLIFSIIRLLELHDGYTKGHSENVANIAYEIGKVCQLNEEELDDLYWAALLHDIGKILINKEILNKKEKLSISEYFEMKEHPTIAYKVLSKTKSTKKIANIVKYHHERWDGKGYPSQLCKEDIPIESRIIALADTFDVICSKRPYKIKKSVNYALKEIKNNLGEQFDPIIGSIFIDYIKLNKKNFYEEEYENVK